MSDWTNGSKFSSSYQGTTASRVLAALAEFHLKQIHPNQYRCNSPLRPGSDSHGFMLIVDPDGEHGAYFDHAHEEDQGSLYDLAARLGIAASLPNAPRPRQLVESTKRVYS